MGPRPITGRGFSYGLLAIGTPKLPILAGPMSNRAAAEIIRIFHRVTVVLADMADIAGSSAKFRVQ